MMEYSVFLRKTSPDPDQKLGSCVVDRAVKPFIIARGRNESIDEKGDDDTNKCFQYAVGGTQQ